MPSPQEPLTGRCLCGAVRFQVTKDFETAGYCHCKRCQRRSGTVLSLGAGVVPDGFELLEGAEKIRTWRPPDGNPKSFCAECGTHVFSGDLEGARLIGVRLGALEGDLGIRPEWHQWVSSAPDWYPLPDDGLPRFSERRQW